MRRAGAWIGIDIGGTFTDFVVYDARRARLFVYKTPTAASKRAEHVLAGLAALMERHAIAGADVTFLGHGTTVATNAVLTRDAPPLGLLTTRGFGDMLVIRRQTRANTFDYYADFPPPLIPRDHVMEVGERMNAAGEVVEPLDAAEVARAVETLAARGIGSIAVTFLHSYANSDHEREVARIVAERRPGALVSLSSDLVPEFREYERASTTVLNAFVRPAVIAYVSKFEEGLAELGITAPLLVMQGNGGIVSTETARRQPVSLVRSGPAAGIAGAAFVAARTGHRRLITCDIGGTSTDVSVFEGERPAVVRDFDLHGFPVKWPTLDIRSIGAGGGSIAWLDGSGLLKVGPQSAGAEPGPACYDRGGADPTVTDAHVVLGRIGPDAVLGDSLRLQSERAHAVMVRLGERLGRSATEAAAGVIEIVNAAIAQEIHYICSEKGQAARDFTLVAYGGAGPLHAAEVARELGIGTVLVPYRPGLVCALGVLASVPQGDFAITHFVDLDPARPAALDSLAAARRQLAARATQWLSEQSIPHRAVHRRWSLDMRYRGQNYELSVAAGEGDEDVAALVKRFHARHEQAYGYRSTVPVQCVNVRLAVSLEVDRPALRTGPATGGRAAASGTRRRKAGRQAPDRRRSVYLGRDHGFAAAPVHRREELGAKATFVGPAIIEQMDATTLVLPGQRAHVAADGNILLESARHRR